MSAHTVDYAKKWYVLAAVGAGVILATIDGSIVNIALPTIRSQLNTTLPVVQWVTLGYLLTLATLTLGVGRWGDVVGKRRIYIAGFVVFTAASVLCGFAPGIGWLIAFRVVQGLGAVMILALGAAILIDAFPPQERGKALGWIGTFVSIGVVSGPVAGGLLIAAFDWPAIFFVNLPLGIIATVMVIRLVPDTPSVGGQRFDYLGAGLFSAALLALTLALTSGQELGYRSPVVIGLLIGGLLLGAAFVKVELGSPSPMLDLRMFANPLLTISLATGFVAFVAVASVFFLLPFYLQGVLGYDTLRTGLALAISPLVLGLVAPAAGNISDRIGVRALTMVGLVVLFGAYLGFRTLSQQTTFAQYSLVAIPLGLGMGIFVSPNNSAIMGAVPRAYAGVAGGMLTLTRLLGQISGVAALGSLWASRVAARAGALTGDATTASPLVQVAALRDTFTVVSVMMALAVATGAVGFWRGRVVDPSTPSPPPPHPGLQSRPT